MNNHMEQQVNGEPSKWFFKVLPFVSALLGGAALWYTWFIYIDNVNQVDFPWHGWIRFAGILLLGICCLAATALLIGGRPSGLSVLKLGLGMIPLMLMLNLVVLLIRVITRIFQGDALPFVQQLFTDPKNMIIPIIVIALVLLGSLSQEDSNKSKD